MTSVAKKWMTLGVPNAFIESGVRGILDSATKATTTNIKPVSPPAEEPTEVTWTPGPNQARSLTGLVASVQKQTTSAPWQASSKASTVLAPKSAASALAWSELRLAIRTSEKSRTRA